MICIELDSVKKYRNASEWRTVPRASCGGFERIGDGPQIGNLCQDLIDAGIHPDTKVEVYRGETRCFTPASLGQWASGNIGRKQPQPAHLRRGEGMTVTFEIRAFLESKVKRLEKKDAAE